MMGVARSRLWLRGNSWSVPIQVALGEGCETASPGAQVLDHVMASSGLSGGLCVGGGWKCAVGSVKCTSNSNGTPWGSWSYCCQRSRDLGTGLMRETAGPQALGCKLSLMPSPEAGTGERSVPAYKRHMLVEETRCPF